MIQFACPSCKAACSVDDKFSGRKIKCPKCGARVMHVRGPEVTLLTAGTVVPPTAAAPAAGPSEATPVATAAVPHLVGEFVRQSESQQNTLVIAGVCGLLLAVLSLVGLLMSVPLLTVTPIGIGLAAGAVWLLVRRKKMESQLQELAARKAVGEKTEPMARG